MKSPPALPQIVRIILSNCGKLFLSGELRRTDFKAKLNRIEKEELTPRGLTLDVRHHAGRSINFAVVESNSGQVLDELVVASPACAAAKHAL